ncbi:hypothetical protein CJD36_014090 [Flavipsychrobacter stenotrophus]|uniref:Uncharacterized protein n=1 Tax=Flavipsychrobacter stenotrophus TaxID=2077091 RepID=A0A2S7SWH7_9BACT|nr:hypothetical protein [Flavipsychrobacter stenotrophus]PQJ11094.1 hypothetical protein CJD36_014090 [Flavipsychrobacter stenotrophus]
MTIAAVKEQLHEYIDHADGKKAMALLAFLKNDFSEKEYVFEEETISMLEERLERYLSGESKGYTLEESMKRINNHRSKNGL